MQGNDSAGITVAPRGQGRQDWRWPICPTLPTLNLLSHVQILAGDNQDGAPRPLCKPRYACCKEPRSMEDVLDRGEDERRIRTRLVEPLRELIQAQLLVVVLVSVLEALLGR